MKVRSFIVPRRLCLGCRGEEERLLTVGADDEPEKEYKDWEAADDVNRWPVAPAGHINPILEQYLMGSYGVTRTERTINCVDFGPDKSCYSYAFILVPSTQCSSGTTVRPRP